MTRYLDRVRDLRRDPYYPTSLPVALILALFNARLYPANDVPPITDTEALTLAAAMLNCTRSGGGSRDYTTFRRFAEIHDLDIDSDAFWSEVKRLSDQHLREAVEYGIVTWVGGAR